MITKNNKPKTTVDQPVVPINCWRWYLDGMFQVDNWKKLKIPQEHLDNVNCWNQQQVLALAEQIQREKLAAKPDPKRYPETVGFAEVYDGQIRKWMAEVEISYPEACLIKNAVDVHKIVYNFRPEELGGRTWREVRVTKGPLWRGFRD